MAIDSMAKRASIAGLVLPDGSIGAADRATMTGLYVATLFGAVVTWIVSAARTFRGPGPERTFR